jgi:peptidoglycan hydrolase FlgJ
MNAPTSVMSAGSAPIGDARALDALRTTAGRDPKAAIQEAARQFEALFIQQLMKSMRDATISSELMENSGTKLGTEMLDTQLASRMSGLPGGLGALIARQLERQMSGGSAPSTTTAGAAPAVSSAAGAPAGAAGALGDAAAVSPRQIEFLRLHAGAARQAESASGIPAAFMMAQAAHESGWGRREIVNADGTASHNLFGIKAGAGWSGPVAEVTTTEWVGGEPQKVTAKFRAYASYAESFQDYARLLKENPRYAGVMAQLANGSASPETFASGLQRAGYATDPAYADKLTRVINTTLRLQRAAS